MNPFDLGVVVLGPVGYTFSGWPLSFSSFPEDIKTFGEPDSEPTCLRGVSSHLGMTVRHKEVTA